MFFFCSNDISNIAVNFETIRNLGYFNWPYFYLLEDAPFTNKFKF